MANTEPTDELPPSKLGTKEHWDAVYGTELANFTEIGDEGEIWFGEESVEKIVEWAVDHLPLSPQPAVLEIGSGNGTLLFALQDELQPQPHLCGIDYSPDAVVLARAIGDARDGSARDVRFEVCDFLTEDLPASLLPEREDKWEGWDLVLDKGTLDAIALGDKDEQGRSPAWAYPSRLAPLIRPNGIFLVTSCNFTEAELRAQFVTPETGLEYHSRVNHRTFTFGGQSGNVVSTVAFQKRS